MMFHRQILTRAWMLLVAGIAVAVVVPSLAQEEEAAATPAKAAVKAKPAAKPPSKPVPEAAAEFVPPNDPAVDAVLETKPNTPADWARAAQLMAQLRRPDLAKGFLQKVLAAKLSDEQLAGLADQFGANMFTDMAGRPELLPEAERLADAVLAAINRRLQDPKRIAEAVRQLQDPSETVRHEALRNLQSARGAAVGALIDVLADPKRAAEHAAARRALTAMRGEAVGPLVGILEHCERDLMVQAISALAEMGARDAVIYLLGPAASEKADPRVREAARAAVARLLGRVPDLRETVETLCRQATTYYQQRQPLKTDIDRRVEQWSWDVKARRCVARSRSAEDASRVLAARLARDAFALNRDDAKARQLYLATMLEEAAYEQGLDKPLDLEKDAAARQAATFPMRELEEAMEFAISNKRPAAAVVVAQILGRFGKAQEVLRQGPDPAPLVRATRHSDRRLRLAAAEAIVQLQPNAPFAGSSLVPETLGFFAATSGQRRVLVVGPNMESARELVGMLTLMHFQVDTATNGRDALRMAASSPDYECLLIDPSITNPVVEVLVQQLRGDCRTATQRIGLQARSGDYQRADRLAEGDPLTLSFARPHLQEAFQWQMNRLAGLGAREFVGFEERQRQAAHAVACLAVMARSSKPLYDLRRVQDHVIAGLYAPPLTAQAVAVLANLGTPESQEVLLDLVSRFARPLEVRKAAAKAFRVSVQKHGILLDTETIRRQYHRYDEAASQDADAQYVLGMVLDAIEEPTEATRPAKAIQGLKKPAAEKPAGKPVGKPVGKKK